MTQLMVVATHLVIHIPTIHLFISLLLTVNIMFIQHFISSTEMKVGLGFSEIDAWTVIETIAEENNLRAEQYVSFSFGFKKINMPK